MTGTRSGDRSDVRRRGRPTTLRRARWSVATTFAVHGLLIGSWAPRIPSVSSRLHLQPGILGLALLGVALGNLAAARVAGAACHRFGSSRTASAASYVYCFAAVLPTLAVGPITLFAALAGWGVAMGFLDVAMNAQGVELEHAYGRRVFAGLHACWSMATFAGALAGGLAAQWHVTVWAQQAALGCAVLAAVHLAARHLLPDRPHAEDSGGAPRRTRVLDLRLALLGLAAVSCLLAEGVAADWSAIYARSSLGASGIGPAAPYAAFCAAMAIGRLTGDRVMDRIGPRAALLGATLAGCIGLAGGLASSSLAGAVAGFGLAGLGLSIMAPLFFGSAPQPPGPPGAQIAIVTGMGYAGMLLGPSLIGLVAQATSVQSALWVTPPFILLAGIWGSEGLRRGTRAARRPA